MSTRTIQGHEYTSEEAYGCAADQSTLRPTDIALHMQLASRQAEGCADPAG